jgi:hypothetical protein
LEDNKKMILTEKGGGLDSTVSGYSQVAGFCRYTNELTGPIKSSKVFKLRNYQLFSK